MDIAELEEDYKFKLETSKNDKNIEFIKFEDGREYKLQHPKFFELHDALCEDNFDSALFQLGLKCLFSQNTKSPAIDEAWLENNKLEGINLWSYLLRGLLSQPKT